MQPLPQLESCLRLAFEARDPLHPSGISLSSWFVRAPTRGRRRGSRTPRSTLRQVLHGVAQRTLRAEPFAAFVIRVLKIAQAAYAAFRHAGRPHDAAWELVQDRLWLPYPTGRSGRSGTRARGA